MRIACSLLAALVVAPSAAAQDFDSPLPKTGPGIGIGGGVTFPATPFALNTASTRVRVMDKLAIEPIIGFVSITSEAELETDSDSSSSEETGTALTVEALARYTIQERGGVAAQVLGGLGYSSEKSESNPDGKDNNTTTEITTMAINWGLGLEYFVSPQWSLCADATNPLYGKTTTMDVSQAADTTLTTTSSAIGLIWAPSIRVMAHLNF